MGGRRIASVAAAAAALWSVLAPLVARAAPAAPTTSAASAATRASFGAEEPTSWQCVQFARLYTGIMLFGDAWTWWEQAVGRYTRGTTPQAGSVLVFKPFGSMKRGHVAVVSQVLTDRIIQVTHANWSPVEGKKGQIENDVTVVDVSSAGDWSQVKVWYKPSGDLGTTVYPTYGFIYRAAAAAARAAQAAGAFDRATRAALAARIAEALH
jgi:surface antigen